MIIGHEILRERLLQSVAKRAIAQSFLFVGPESVGKFLVAQEYSRTIRGIASAEEMSVINHPDERIVEPVIEKKKGVKKELPIGVDVIREATVWLQTFPYSADKKVLIVRDAHRMTETAQNALLKILEEPPKYAVIILVTHNEGAMLPTIVSRCNREHFRLVKRSELERAIRLTGDFGPLLPRHAFLFESGRPGVVIRGLQGDETCAEQIALFEKLAALSTMPLRERLVLSERYTSDGAELARVVEWWIGALHEKLLDVQCAPEESARQLSLVHQLLRDIRRFPSSVRLLFETFVLQWK